MVEGIFPDTLIIAKIIPVFKSGDSKSISNYRHISILTSFSKIFEKIIAVRITY
jgi:Notch-like protein